MIVVRRAVPDDAERIADIQITGWRETYPHLLSPDFLAGLEPQTEGYREGIARAVRAVYNVAELDGDVVGFAIAGPPREDDPPRDWELALLYQYARAHGSGTGQALLDAAIGDRPAFLWVAEGNPRAQAFYRRNGFVPDGARKVAADWEDLAEIRMVR
jgi:GNAT superfamily N-acetyltransferase